MHWVITFVIAWILFLVFLDYSRLKNNIVGGFLAVVLATIVDCGAQQLRLYKFNEVIVSWFGCSIFYIWGPIFTMGVLFVQFVPRKKWWQFLHILIFSLSFTTIDYLYVRALAADYINWHWLASLIFNIITFGNMTWITIMFIQDRV